MRAGNAIAEDLRRVGVAAIVTGVVGGFFQDQVPLLLAGLLVVFGGSSCVLGYRLHSREED